MKEVKCIDRKTKGMALLLTITIAAVAGGILLMAQASNVAATTTNAQSNSDAQLAVVTTTSDTTGSADSTTGDATNIVPGWCEGPMGFGRRGMGFAHDFRGFSGIEVSDEYKAAVTTILESDTDVQQLLTDGYNVTRIMPIVKTVIDGEGNVATTATNATVILSKEGAGLAFVSVDLTQNKVTQIVTYTKTVIEK
jgi:hypothetical protein